MGWDNWNAFGCSVSEELLLSTAKTMVDYGLRDLGYKYVVLDDCWSVGRNDSGYLVENPVSWISLVVSVFTMSILTTSGEISQRHEACSRPDP
jgi:alpha-galactosidase